MRARSAGSTMTAMRASVLALALVLASCAAPAAAPSPSAPTPATSRAPSTPGAAPSATPTPAPTATPASIPARRIANLPGRAVLSPNGKWIAAVEPPPTVKTPYVPAALVHDIEGRLIRRIEVPGGWWRWLPDSSGLFVALDAPQRSPSLGIVDLASGATRETGLMMAGATLSRDGRWIFSDHQEGCCMFVEQQEIWVAPRGGGPARLFVRSKTERQQPIGVIGVDAEDRLVYRDHDEILRMPVAGGASRVLGTLTSAMVLDNEMDGTAGDSSPDATVLLVRTIEPLRWYVIANDRVTAWDDASGAIVEDRLGFRLQHYAAALWVGPHALLVRAPGGELASYDARTGATTPLRGTLGANDFALAHDRGRLLVGRGKVAAVIDLATGRTATVDVELGSEIEGSRAAALPDGGFILSTAAATYRID